MQARSALVLSCIALLAACTSKTSSSNDNPQNVGDAGGDDGTHPGSKDSGGDGDDGSAGDDGGGEAGDDGGSGTPGVQLVGRFDDTDPAAPVAAWPGVREVVRFDGTDVSVKLSQTPGFSGGPSWFDVIVDGTLGTPFSVTGSNEDHVLATGLSAGTHTVEIVKRTEPNLGTVTFGSFTFGNGGKLLAPPARPKRRIEVLTDSTIDGFGVEGNATTTCGGGAPAEFNNAEKSTAAFTAKTLGAELVLLGYSGKGITKNQDGSVADTYPQIYGRIIPDTAGSTWAFASNVPDAVVISLGGTDFDGLSSEPAGFSAGYDALVGNVRTHYPNAHIFATVWSQIKDLNLPNTRSAMRASLQGVVNARKGAGDSKIWYFEFPEADFNQDETGCYYHANAAHHAAMAALLSNEIKTRLGW
jgi:hypothetical protein